MHDLREIAAQRAHCATYRRFGRRIDHVGHGLGLRQIEFVVEVRAPRELTRLGQPCAELERSAQQHARYHRAAVTVQFEHVFTGIGVRRRKEQHQSVVDDGAMPVQEFGAHRLARGKRLAGEGNGPVGQAAAGDAHNADSASSARRGDRGDRVTAGRRCHARQAVIARLPVPPDALSSSRRSPWNR